MTFRIRCLFLFLIFIAGFESHSQSNSDSLLHVYDSLGKKYGKDSDIIKAIFFFNKSLEIQKNNHDTAGMIKSLEFLSKSYQQQNEYDKAIELQLEASKLKYALNKEEPNIYYKRVKKLKENGNDSLNLTRLYYRYALLLDKLEKKKQSIDFFSRSLELAHKLNYDKAVATIANDLAGEYWDLGEKNLSTLKYKEALKAAKAISDSNLIAAIYLNIGDNYKELGDYENSMKFFIKALKVKESIENTSRLSFYYIKAAEISKASHNYKKWKKYISKAYKLINNKNYTSLLDKVLIYQNLGEIAEHENNLQDALKYYDTSLIVSKSFGYQNGIRSSYINKASIYKNMNHLKEALKMMEEAKKYKTENPYYLLSSNVSLAELYMQTGDYKKAYNLLIQNINDSLISNYADLKLQTLGMLYKSSTNLSMYKEALKWNDSLRNFENYLLNMKVRTKIAELETKYETEKNKNIIGKLKTKNQYYNQQIKIAGLLIFLLIAAIIIGIFISRINKLKASYREDKLKQQMLRLQMSPHFIFNALNSIQQLIIENKNKEAHFYLSRFSSISRIILEYSTQESIPLDKEIDLLQSYIEIEKLRAANGFRYKIEYDSNLETEFINIPPMIIQPFVENAIKHGLKNKKGNGLLILKFMDKEEILQVVIEDNGSGIKNNFKKGQKGHKSLAMEIFEKRRKLLQKLLKRNLTIKIVDLSSENGSGTRVIIDLPIL